MPYAQCPQTPEPRTQNSEHETPLEDLDKLYTENREEMDKVKSALAEYLANLRCRKYPEYMTSREVMEFLRITPLTLFRYRQQGVLTGYKVKNKYRYRFREVYGLVHCTN